MFFSRRLPRKSILLLVSACLAAPAAAQEAAPPESLRDRAQLFGDWHGARAALAQRGIIVDFQATQFYQGVVRGSAGTNDWQYGAKADMFTTVLGERLGLWKGLIINMHLEGRVGDDVNGLSGLSPANAPMLMPSSQDEVALTQFMAIQMLRPDFGIAGGKFSAYDFTDMAFHTGRGIDGFMNTSLVLPLGLGRTVPLGLLGAGAIKFQGKEVQGSLLVYDPNDCATSSCLEEPFQDASILGMWKFFTGIGPEGKDAGYIAVGGTYSGKRYAVVDPQSFAVIPGQGLAFTDTDTSWSLYSVVNQQLWADASNPGRNLNFKGMYTITDGKANPIKWSATAAFEMNGPLPDRSKDVFGVGYFHNELADGFKDIVGPLLSFASGTEINIEDTEGFEAFYKAQLTPWFALTGDVQVITETLSTEETKVVTGVRAKVTF